MTKGVRSIKNDEAELLAGVSASSSVRRSGQPVILMFSRAEIRRHRGSEEAIEPEEESFESLGSIAVRLMAEWKLPRCELRAKTMPGGG